MMFAHRLVMLNSSGGLNVASNAGRSVVTKLPPITAGACSVVPHACAPPTTGLLGEPAKAALLVQVVPVKEGPGPVAVVTSLITALLGRMPVNVLKSTSFVTDKETSPFGVIKQEQQATSCSSGEKP